MANNDNFDFVLAIPCEAVNGRRLRDASQAIASRASLSLEKSARGPVVYGKTELEIKNTAYNHQPSLAKYARLFCEQIEEHGSYELFFNDSSIFIKREPLVYGQVILYEDQKNDEYIPRCCYNFFCVLSELIVNEDSKFKNNTFNIVYFVVPDINYHDLTLLMDQSGELWCNIEGNMDSRLFLKDYLDKTGYKQFGKIYRIVFSDSAQYKTITGDVDSGTKLFNILAAEEYKDNSKYSHQIALSENTHEYVIASRGTASDVKLVKKEKFFDDYSMYASYKAFASIYSYYYVINDEDKDIFSKRIEPDETDEGFSSEANILFVLETELFKITACLALGRKINEQINNPNMREIKKMFEGFINTRPLFEKLNYRYLGAQKEADFIYKQFRIGDMINDYDRKRDLLKSYSEVANSITASNNSKVLNCIGILFTFIAGFDRLSNISHIIFDDEKTIKWNIDFIIPAVFSLLIMVIIIKITEPVKHLKSWLRSVFRRHYTVN
jgi:hypothetical protein